MPRPLAFVGAWSVPLLLGLTVLAALGWLLLQLFVVVVPVVLALFLAAALQPLVAWLRGRGLPAWLAAAAVFLGLLALLVTAGYWLTVELRSQLDLVGQSVQVGVDHIQRWLVDGPLGLPADRVRQLDLELRSVVGGIGATDSGFAQRVMGRVRLAFEAIGGLALLLFVLFLLLKDGRQIGGWALGHLPERFRGDATALADRAQKISQRFFLGVAAVGTVDATLFGLALLVIGVPLTLPLATLTFFAAFFPLLGALIAGAAATLVALVTDGPGEALLVAVAAFAIQQIDANVLQPLILGAAVRLHPIVTTVAVTTGLLMGGLLGAFLAVPLTALVAQTAGYYAARARE